MVYYLSFRVSMLAEGRIAGNDPISRSPWIKVEQEMPAR